MRNNLQSTIEDANRQEVQYLEEPRETVQENNQEDSSQTGRRYRKNTKAYIKIAGRLLIRNHYHQLKSHAFLKGRAH